MAKYRVKVIQMALSNNQLGEFGELVSESALTESAEKLIAAGYIEEVTGDNPVISGSETRAGALQRVARAGYRELFGEDAESSLATGEIFELIGKKIEEIPGDEDLRQLLNDVEEEDEDFEDEEDSIRGDDAPLQDKIKTDADANTLKVNQDPAAPGIDVKASEDAGSETTLADPAAGQTEPVTEVKADGDGGAETQKADAPVGQTEPAADSNTENSGEAPAATTEKQLPTINKRNRS